MWFLVPCSLGSGCVRGDGLLLNGPLEVKWAVIRVLLVLYGK